MKTLLVNPAVLSLEKIVTQTDSIIMVVATSRPLAHCPQCQQLSRRVHSRYQRVVTDLPWGEIAVRLELQTRKFFCDNDKCRQRIFCERLPEVVAPYGRQTIRFNKSLMAIGFALGGRAGERLASDLYLSSSARTLLRRIYDVPVDKIERVRILGVDDFAFRKGQRYGTILVDLERHRVIDLLADREGSTLEGWLKSHPEVELITRDRAMAYADGATKGAPQAVQVADRFHLIKNLVEAFENLARRHSSALREAALEVSPRRQTEMMLLAEGLLADSGDCERSFRLIGRISCSQSPEFAVRLGQGSLEFLRLLPRTAISVPSAGWRIREIPACASSPKTHADAPQAAVKDLEAFFLSQREKIGLAGFLLNGSIVSFRCESSR